MFGLPPADEALLASSVDSAVTLGLRHGGILGKTPKDEPQAVVAVYSTLIMLRPLWSWVFAAHGARVAMQGAFIHGKPQVAFNKHKAPPDRCELGDLLLVIDDARRGREDRRALVIQAKPVKGRTLHLTKPNERKQLDLNVNWPVFTFVTPGYGTASRDFRDAGAPGSVDESSAYGAVDIAGETWEQLVPSMSMVVGTGEPLSRTLTRMVVGSAGRKAEYPATPATPCSDDWSETVRLLLEQSAGAITGKTLGATDRAFLTWARRQDDSTKAPLWFDPARLGGERTPIDRGHEDDGGGGMDTFQVVITDLEGPR